MTNGRRNVKAQEFTLEARLPLVGDTRLSLTLPDDRVDEGLRRIAAVPALV
jgi:hypothetical protein